MPRGVDGARHGTNVVEYRALRGSLFDYRVAGGCGDRVSQRAKVNFLEKM